MMKREEVMIYENKKVKIFLKNKFVYTCRVISVLEDSIRIIDKYHNLITISLKDISIITEMNEELEDEEDG